MSPWMLVAALGAAPAAVQREPGVSLDVREADVREIVTVLAGAGELQTVFNPGIDCRLTLKLKDVSWRVALDTSLRACRLGMDLDGRVVRIAPVTRLIEETADRKKLAEQRAATSPDRILSHRLSYARVEQMAALLKPLLPRGDVTYDARTNTLLITY